MSSNEHEVLLHGPVLRRLARRTQPQPRQTDPSENVLLGPVKRRLAPRIQPQPQPRQTDPSENVLLGPVPRKLARRIPQLSQQQPQRNQLTPFYEGVDEKHEDNLEKNDELILNERLNQARRQRQLNRETPFNRRHLDMGPPHPSPPFAAPVGRGDRGFDLGLLHEKVQDTSSDDEPEGTDHLAPLVQQQQQLDISGIAALVDFLTKKITLNYKDDLNKIIKYIDRDIFGVDHYIKYLKNFYSQMDIDSDILDKIKTDLIQFEKENRGVFRVNKKGIQDVIKHKQRHLVYQLENLKSDLRFDVVHYLNRKGKFELIGKPLSEIINHLMLKKNFKVIERIKTYQKKTNENFDKLFNIFVCLEILSLIVGEQELSSPSLETISYPQPQQASPQKYFNIRLPVLPKIGLHITKQYNPLQIEKLTVLNDDFF